MTWTTPLLTSTSTAAMLARVCSHYQPRLPCDPSQIRRLRRILGAAGVEQLLKTTLQTAVALKAVKTSGSNA